MNRAAQLAAQLEQLSGDAGIRRVEAEAERSLDYDVLDDVMCIMHSDGSVNMIEHAGGGVMRVETISSRNVLAVLKHFRPFGDVFKDQLQ